MSEPLLHDLPPLITRYRWRTRIGTALAVAIVGGTVGVLWYYFVRAPGPRSVCDHVAWLRRTFPEHTDGLAEATASRAMSETGPAVPASSDQACMWYFVTEERQRSFIDYGRLARCVTFAETPRELYPCVY